MSSKTVPVNPFDLVVFGATGDLSLRKLMPALYHRFLAGQMPPQSRIIGVARSQLDTATFKNKVHEALQTYVGTLDIEVTERFIECIEYHPQEMDDKQAWKCLAKQLKESRNQVRMYYLAVGPSLFALIVNTLAEHGLAAGDSRLIIEKPFGKDATSARLLNQQITSVFDEQHIYRIDHYLGKETVQNLMTLRFANALFEPIWNSHHIDHVQITVAEAIGAGNRTEYYDSAGAIRDMVQNHLLQLLCLLAMEPPWRFEANAVRNEKLKVLQSLRPLTGQAVLTHTVRGQYQGYLAEVGVAAGVKHSATETYVAMKAEIDNWRWAGVPFYMRTGKCLSSRYSEIAIQYKEPAHILFADSARPSVPNVLSIRLQPDEGLRLEIMTKEPGPGGLRMHNTPLDMTFAGDKTKNWRMPDAYERLLMDVARGDQTLFMRGDEVEAAWHWIDPVIAAWHDLDMKPEIYGQGHAGPVGAMEMMARDHRRWRSMEHAQ